MVGINDVGAAPATDNLQGKGFTDNTRQLSWQLQVQSSKYPEFEAQSLSETFYYLRQAIHYMNPEHESLSFFYQQYRENKLIIGMSFEKERRTPPALENTVKTMLWSNPHKIGNIYHERL